MKPALLLDADRANAPRDWNDGIIVDNFAGGGGASTGIERALRRQDDLAAMARYIVANPLRAGLVDFLGDYPHWDCAWPPENLIQEK